MGRVRPGPIQWTTDNDPVLDVREAPDRLSAKVKATALGMSNVYIKAGQDEHRVHVRVVPMNDTTNEAVTLGGSIGTETPE